jgi:hypothetical protein
VDPYPRNLAEAEHLPLCNSIISKTLYIPGNRTKESQVNNLKKILAKAPSKIACALHT